MANFSLYLQIFELRAISQTKIKHKIKFDCSFLSSVLELNNPGRTCNHLWEWFKFLDRPVNCENDKTIVFEEFVVSKILYATNLHTLRENILLFQTSRGDWICTPNMNNRNTPGRLSENNRQWFPMTRLGTKQDENNCFTEKCQKCAWYRSLFRLISIEINITPGN